MANRQTAAAKSQIEPNANLQEQASLLRSRKMADAVRLNELRTLLHDWLKSGGSEPDWSAQPDATVKYNGWDLTMALYR